MNPTDAKKEEFVRLIDHALNQSEEMAHQVPARADQLHPLVSELHRIRADVLADRLQPSQGTLTLGLARGLADWVEPLDSPLLEAVGAVERYYQQYLN